MAWSLLGHFVEGSGGGFTTAAQDTTGADMLIIFVQRDPTYTFVDSKSNTWTRVDGAGGYGNTVDVLVARSPIVGTGHTFTMSGTSINVLAGQFWSGSDGGAADVHNAAGATNATTLQPGSITPSVDGELIVLGCWGDNESAGSLSVNSGFTIADQLEQTAGVHQQMGSAYLIQASAAAVNPTWSDGSNHLSGAVIAAFKVGGGGGPTVRKLAALGVG